MKARPPTPSRCRRNTGGTGMGHTKGGPAPDVSAPVAAASRAARPPALPVFHCHVLLWMGGADIFRARADQAIVVELLNHVGGPAADAGDGEDGREQVHVNAQRGVSGSRVKIHVGIELFLCRASPATCEPAPIPITQTCLHERRLKPPPIAPRFVPLVIPSRNGSTPGP
jgi:hypothetical protein